MLEIWERATADEDPADWRARQRTSGHGDKNHPHTGPDLFYGGYLGHACL
jgi:hypothetical protein